MTDSQIAAVAMIDQMRAAARDQHPDKSKRWRDVWILRAIHHQLNDGDMSGAPEFPQDEGADD